jgi:hypothetical protein
MVIKSRGKQPQINLPVLLLSPGTALILLASEFGWQVLKSSSVMVEVAMCCCMSVLLDHRRHGRKQEDSGAERMPAQPWWTGRLEGLAKLELYKGEYKPRCKTGQPCLTGETRCK